MTFNKGQKVKVDRGGAGLGIQFLTIKNSFTTDNCNGYLDYSFEELSEDIHISEYYIRPITDSDIKIKELMDTLNVKEYKIDSDDINEVFWKVQKPFLEKTIDFLDGFMNPYLEEFQHFVTADKICDWDFKRKNSMILKNDYVSKIPSDLLNIVCLHTSTDIKLYITSKDRYEDDKALCIYSFGMKYSDDEYQAIMVTAIQDIINKTEKRAKYELPYVHLDFELRNQLQYFIGFCYKNYESNCHTEIPKNFAYLLSKLDEIPHYCLNKEFN